MADVSALPVQDWGNMMTSFGRGTAEQQQSQAQTGLIGQQTQAAAMQNQLMRARMPLIMHALQDFNTDPHGDSDTSGESPPPTEGGATAPAGGSPTQNSGTSNWYDPARVDAGLRQRFFVNPAGTPQELQRIMQAGVSGDQGLLEAAKAQRDIGTQQRVSQNQSEANGLYETMSSVSNAPDGSALDALAAVSPQAAAKIKSLIPDGVEEDAAARQYASHVASTVHQYSGRKVTADTGGTFRDETTGEPVTGVPNAGMNQEQWTNLANHETELVPMKQSDGSESQVPRWQAEGNKSLQQGIMRAAAKGNVPGASPTISGAPRAQATAAASTAAATASKGPARAAAPPVTSSAQLLPGVDLNSLPKASIPSVSGRTPKPIEQAKIDAFKENYKTVQTDAQRTLAETNQSDALLTPMQAKMNAVNPRDVGPGSTAYKALMDFKTAVTGKAPQDLVDMGILDKFANQLGVQNVRQLLSGQRITNQEMMNFLTRASASTTQPLDVMKAIISYQKANNDFDRKYSTTALAALGRGVDPGSISALQNGRTAFVQSAMDRDLGPAPVVKQLPTGARLQKYAETHFNGDQKAARAHLMSQGYTE